MNNRTTYYLYVITCINTGLLFLVLMWQAFHPLTTLRLLGYGGGAIVVAFVGTLACDRIRWRITGRDW